ncbi:MAG: hypothetical protein AB8G11_16405 [Saprospiraceae bacterium]
MGLWDLFKKNKSIQPENAIKQENKILRIDKSCFEGMVELRTQKQVDNFGQMPYRTIKGNLLIGFCRNNDDGESDINDLSVLNKISTIEGQLVIVKTQLSNLVGFFNLEVVSNDVIIEENKILGNLSGLNKLRHIGLEYKGSDLSYNGSLHISYNQSLFSLEGLNKLTHIGGNLKIKHNNSLETLNGLGSSNYTIFLSNTPGVHIIGNKSLKDVDALKMLGGCDLLEIAKNNRLTSISSLEYLRIKQLEIKENKSLKEIIPFKWVKELSFLCISDNSKLNDVENVEILKNKTPHDRIVIMNNAVSIHINPNAEFEQMLDNVKDKVFKGHIELRTQSDIDKFYYAYDYNVIEGNLYIGHCKKNDYEESDIDSLMKLRKINEIRGELIIMRSNLINLEGLENLHNVQYLVIEDNEELVNLDGLSSLSSIGKKKGQGGLHIVNNSVLNSVRGINQLEYVEDFILIKRNHDLLTLNGLGNVKLTNGSIKIQNNQSLRNLTSFRQITELKSLTVEDNKQLSDKKNVKYLVKNATSNQKVTIERNGKGCNLGDLI